MMSTENTRDGFHSGPLLSVVQCSTYWHSYISSLASGILGSLYPLNATFVAIV